MEQAHQVLVQINVQLENIVLQEVQVVQIARPVHIVQRVLEVVQRVAQVSIAQPVVQHVVR